LTKYKTGDLSNGAQPLRSVATNHCTYTHLNATLLSPFSLWSRCLGEFNNNKMASRRPILATSIEPLPAANDPLRELFEACKTGDISRVKRLISPQTVNARDTAGRKSTPLHFAAGECFPILRQYFSRLRCSK
jgi:hypothetical protein